MNRQEIPEWIRGWTTEYALLSTILFGEEYTRTFFDEVGCGFSKVIFLYEKGLATVFRLETEQNAFSDCTAKKILLENNFMETLERRLTEIQNHLLGFTELEPATVIVPSRFTEFLELHRAYLPYYVAVLWAPNSFAHYGASMELQDKAFSLCERLRKRSEPVYPRLEMFLKSLFKHIGEKSGMDDKILLALTLDEAWVYVQTGALPKRDLLQSRYDYCVVSSERGESTILDEYAGRRLIGEVSPDVSTFTEMRGVGVSKGVVRGIARVVFRGQDLDKVQTGDILVTTTTRPEWIHAMMRAGAFVTEIGSVLSHAAIVSRELKKPCIIGTKIATKVLKDGDMVEVDADKGIVRKL